MKITKNLLTILYVLIFVMGDPQLTKACTIGYIGISNPGLIRGESVFADPYGRTGEDGCQIVYILNGGENNPANRNVYYEEEFPVTFNIPTREGYNFAGWYTDSGCTKKITQLNKDNAEDMILFAKWTESIDSYLNVEMYSYETGRFFDMNQKELKQCNYNFLDELEIPGMPSTREKDYIDNSINSSRLCMQGLCFTPDYVIMTAYADEEDEPGALMVFDRENGEYLVTLGMKKNSHLGGVAFDGENLWVCHSNSKTLERISYDYIKLIAEDAPGYCIDASAISDEYRLKNTPSCITAYGGRLWVATYRKMFHSQMYSYAYDAETDHLLALGNYNIPCKVQGVAFDAQGTVYLSTSLGRKRSSYLKVYSSLLMMNENPETPAAKVEMPPCSEEIAVDDNHIYVLFESASPKYFEGTDGKGTSLSPIDKILEVEMASIW